MNTRTQDETGGMDKSLLPTHRRRRGPLGPYLALAAALGVAAVIIGLQVSLSSNAAEICSLTVAACGVLGLTLQAIARHAAQLETRQRDVIAAECERLEQAIFAAQASATHANQAKAELADSLTRASGVYLNEIARTGELLMETDLTEGQQEQLQAICESAERLGRVINDTMDLSAIEVGKLKLETIDFSLRCCLDDLLDALRPSAAGKGLALTSIVGTDIPDALRGDPARLRQVLGNLVGNAIKFTQQGNVTVQVGIEARRDGAVDLRFAVCDTGSGLSPQTQQSLGKMFQDPGGYVDSGPGGSGLLISARLVKIMGGRMWLAPRTGGGSEFYFAAPFGMASLSEAAVRHKPTNLRGMAVLLAGANAAHLDMLRSGLNQWQMQPVLVSSGQAALAELDRAAAAGKAYPLMILDSCLQDMDGFGLAQKISQDPSRRGLVTFMFTARGRRGDAGRCRQLGLAAYLTPPVTPALLLTAVRTALETPANQDRPLLTRHYLREAQNRSRILLVDQDQANQKVVLAVAAGWGHTVTVVPGVPSALAALAEEPFDLVLLSGSGAAADAPQALAAIRAAHVQGTSAVAVVCLIDLASGQQMQRCLQAGAAQCLNVPIDSQELGAVLDKVRQSRKAVPLDTILPAQADSADASSTARPNGPMRWKDSPGASKAALGAHGTEKGSNL